MLEYIFGLVTGSVLLFFFSMIEWNERIKIERKIERIWEHLSCGQGYLGCEGGPNCNSDHK